MRQTFGNVHPTSGHYSNAVRAGQLLFVSGQGPLDLSTGRVVEGDLRMKARQCLRNIETILRDADASLDDVVRTTVYLHDWSDFGTLNEVYADVFPENPPARSTVQGTRPPGHQIAVEAIAHLP